MKCKRRPQCFSTPLACRATVAWLSTLLALAVSGAAHGDGSPSAPPSTATRVTIDLRAQSVNGTIPSDVPFAMTGDAPQGVDVVRVFYRECPAAGCALITRGAACSLFSPGEDKDHEQEWKPAANRPLVWQRDPVLQSLRKYGRLPRPKTRTRGLHQTSVLLQIPRRKSSRRATLFFRRGGCTIESS